MRFHISGKEKDILLDVIHERGLTASRAIAYIVSQWHLNEARKKEQDGNKTKRSN